MFEDYFKSHSPKGSCNFERIFKYSQARFIRLTSAVSNSIQLSAAEMRSGKCVKRRVFNMADEGTGQQSTQILRNQNEKKKGDNATVCVVSMIRLHWDKNGQASYFSLAGSNLRMLNKLT